jgi:hypothetical protein
MVYLCSSGIAPAGDHLRLQADRPRPAAERAECVREGGNASSNEIHELAGRIHLARRSGESDPRMGLTCPWIAFTCPWIGFTCSQSGESDPRVGFTCSRNTSHVSMDQIHVLAERVNPILGWDLSDVRACESRNDSRRPRQRLGESGDVAGEPLGMRGDEVEKLVTEHRADALPISCRHVFEREDLDARDAHLKLGESPQLGNGHRQVVAERTFDFLLIPGVHRERDELAPRQQQGVPRLLAFQFSGSIQPRRSPEVMARTAAASRRVYARFRSRKRRRMLPSIIDGVYANDAVQSNIG